MLEPSVMLKRFPRLTLVSSVMFFASMASAAPCPAGQRRVEPGTTVYGGPGLGFKVIELIDKSECRFVRESTQDGSFSLIELSEARVGWVATGLVDVLLNENDSALPTRIEREERVILLDTGMRVAPRVDATATRILPKGTSVVLEGESSNGLWVLVSAAGVRGWIPRYQSAVAIPKPGDSPAATSGPWHVREGYVPPLTAESPGPAKNEQSVATAAESPTNAQSVEGGASAENQNAGGSRDNAAEADWLEDDGIGAMASSSLPSLGRAVEISLGGGPSQWSQGYLSDAQNDPLYRYQLASTGFEGAMQVIWRGHFPLSVGAGFYGGGYGFQAAAEGIDADANAYRNAAVLGGSLDVGWRLTSTRDFDVESALGVGFQMNWIDALADENGTPITALVSSLHLQALRPSVAVRRRLDEGRWGQVYLQIAMPISVFSMLGEPGPEANYIAARQNQGLNPPLNNEKAGAGPDEALTNVEAQASTSHLGVGVEGRARYSFPLTSFLYVYGDASLRVVQAWIEGPGLRWKGAYSVANQSDMVGALQAGFTMTF